MGADGPRLGGCAGPEEREGDAQVEGGAGQGAAGAVEQIICTIVCHYTVYHYYINAIIIYIGLIVCCASRR
eukprot:COSAG06_NODE_2770_length_6314_cov_1.878681_1_plen_71_part_00